MENESRSSIWENPVDRGGSLAHSHAFPSPNKPFLFLFLTMCPWSHSPRTWKLHSVSPTQLHACNRLTESAIQELSPPPSRGNCKYLLHTRRAGPPISGNYHYLFVSLTLLPRVLIYASSRRSSVYLVLAACWAL